MSELFETGVKSGEVGSLDRRAAELREVMRQVIEQFKRVNQSCASSPHAELNVQELRLIEYLGRGEPRMMRELSEHLSVAVNSMTSIVDNLERKELVRRRRSKEDRRVIRVEVTEAGQAISQEIDALRLRMCRGLLGPLTDEEQEIFIVLFRKIARMGSLR